MAKVFIADSPSRKDSLGYFRIRDTIQHLLSNRDPNEPSSISIGIYGGWGTGKSSLLLQIQDKLEGVVGKRPDEKRYRIINYSPWEFQDEKNQLLPFLLCLSKQARKPFLYPGLYLLYAVLHLFEIAIHWIIKTLSGGLLDSKKIHETVEARLEKKMVSKTLGDEARLKDELKKFIKKLRRRVVFDGNEGHWYRSYEQEILILIDDLDRCHPPEKILDLLEKIKVFLDLPGCIFIIACDRTVVVDAIENQFPGLGEKYLEKFIQVPYYLPDRHPVAIRDIFGEFVGGITQDKDVWFAYWEHLLPLLEFNPRRVKRLYNHFLLYWETMLADTRRYNFEEPCHFHALKWVVLMEYWDSFRRDPEIIVRVDCTLKEKRELPAQFLAQESISSELYEFLRFTSSEDRSSFMDVESMMVYRYGNYKCMEHKLFTYERKARHKEPITEVPAIIGLDFGRLMEVEFSGTDLPKGKRLNLIGTSFKHANLENAKFRDLVLEDVDFSHADLTDARFDNVKFVRVSMTGANISGIQLQNCTDLKTVDPSKVRNKLLDIHTQGKYIQKS